MHNSEKDGNYSLLLIIFTEGNLKSVAIVVFIHPTSQPLNMKLSYDIRCSPGSSWCALFVFHQARYLILVDLLLCRPTFIFRWVDWTEPSLFKAWDMVLQHSPDFNFPITSSLTCRLLFYIPYAVVRSLMFSTKLLRPSQHSCIYIYKVNSHIGGLLWTQSMGQKFVWKYQTKGSEIQMHVTLFWFIWNV